MGYLSLKTQLLWSPEAKWSNDLVKCGSPGVPVKYLAAFLNHILQDSAKSEDSPLHVWLRYLLNLRQFHSSRSTQIKASAFLFSPRLSLVLPLMLVVVLICPWEAPDQRADLEEVLKHNNPFPVSPNSCQHVCIPSQTAAFYITAALILQLTAGVERALPLLCPPYLQWLWHAADWCDSIDSWTGRECH